MTTPTTTAAQAISPAATEKAMKVLQNLGYWGGMAQPDGTIVLHAHIDLKDKGLTALPDLSLVILHGMFDCAKNRLIDLAGAPRHVTEDFYCDNNNLASLKGAPDAVGGTFSCKYNNLKNLLHAPQKVGQSFYCRNNQLQTLAGGPKEIGEGDRGEYDCSYNKLIDLQGAPRIVPGGFNCTGNRLTSLQGGPEHVGRVYMCEGNALKSLEGASKNASRDGIYCTRNPLQNLDHAPPGIINCAAGKFASLHELPDRLLSAAAQERLREEKLAAFRAYVRETTTISQSVKPLKTIRFKPATTVRPS